MASFGGLLLTNKGRNLQAKAQVGTTLNFTKMAIGDGSLNGSSILELSSLKNERKSMTIKKLKVLNPGQAVVGSVLNNQDVVSGFYFREIGVFANDPDIGEILYCYGNAGATADYIPAGSGGGTDIIEKTIDVITLVGNNTNVTATINSSLVFTTIEEFNRHTGDSDVHVTPEERQKWNVSSSDLISHKENELPHQFTDTNTNTTYEWGLGIENGEVFMIYQEVGGYP